MKAGQAEREEMKPQHTRPKPPEAVAGGLKSPRMPRLVRWILYAFIFSICFENYVPWGGASPYTISKMVGILLLLTCGLNWRAVFAKSHWTIWLLIWMWLVLASSTLLASSGSFALREAFFGPLFTLGQCFALYWLCTNIFRDQRTAAYGVFAYALGAALMGGLVSLNIGRVVMLEGAVERVTFLGANPNWIASAAAVGITALVGLVTENILRWGVWRYGLLVLVPLMLMGVNQSGSRGAIVSAGLGLACLLFSGGTWRKRIASGLLILSLAAAGYFLAKGTALYERMEETIDTGSLGGRETLWPAFVEVIKQKPLLGWGMRIGEFGQITGNPLDAVAGHDPHNVYLAWCFFGGLLAGLPLMFLSIWWIYKTFLLRTGRWGMIPLGMTVVILSTLSKGGGTYLSKVTWVLLAFATAAVARLPASRRQPARKRLSRRQASEKI